MNTGIPTHASDGEKDQVKLNQQTPTTSSPNVPPSSPPDDQSLSNNQGQATASPGVNQAVPPVEPTASPSAPSTTLPRQISGQVGASPPPSASPPADTGQTEPDMGIGKPNIGVELEEKTAPATISVSSPKIDIPGQTPAQPPPTNQPAQALPKPTTPAPSPKKDKIEASATDIPVKSYDRTRTQEQPTQKTANIPVSPALGEGQPASPGQPPAAPPIKTSSGSPATMITILAILALIIGASGGFFGFRYWDRMKTSASQETTTSPSPTVRESPSLDVNLWQTYTSTVYNFSLKFPNGWFASTSEPTADNVTFAANKDSLAGEPSGFRVEINFQDANGKTLRSWVEANAVTIDEKNPAKEITVDGQTAYQQELTNPRPAVATYIARGEKIMVVTLTAPSGQMGAGGDWYNNLINSIKLM